MSYKKFKVISPESVRNPENGHIYLGYGYSSTYDDTAPWIKKEDGSFYLISGGTGGGGGESGVYVPYINAIKNVDLGSNNLTVGGETYVEYLDVSGNLEMTTNNSKIQAAIRTTGGAASINLPAASTPNSLSDGDIWTTTTSIYARINGKTKDLAATGSSSYWSTWSTYGIQYTDGSTWMKNSYIGTTASFNANDDILTVKGAITLSNTTKTNVGTIRYNTSTSDFEGYIGTKWYSLTAGAHEANANEFIYNDSGDALVGTSKLMYSTNGIGVNISEPKSSFEVSGSFGSKTTIVTSNITLDETHHTIICASTSLITITLPRIQTVGTSCANREYTICRYGTGNIRIQTSTAEPLDTEYTEFYGSTNSGVDGEVDFDVDVPLGANSEFILYQVTIRAVVNYPESGKSTWLVTNFSSAYGTR